MEGWLRRRWRLSKITFLSMFYNCHLRFEPTLNCVKISRSLCWKCPDHNGFSADYVFDTLMQPAFWFVDGFTLVLGPIFVAMVIFLTSSVVFLTYWIGLPYYQEHKSFALLCFLVVLGHYILVNIVFHFLSALLIHPGTIPADTVNLTQVRTKYLKLLLIVLRWLRFARNASSRNHLEPTTAVYATAAS